MLSSTGFDLWADGYDRAVGLSDEDGTYPFAGYRAVLNAVYQDIRADKHARSVLDMGVGTVYLGVSTAERTYPIRLQLTGNRARVRTLAMKHAVNALRLEALGQAQ